MGWSVSPRGPPTTRQIYDQHKLSRERVPLLRRFTDNWGHKHRWPERSRGVFQLCTSIIRFSQTSGLPDKVETPWVGVNPVERDSTKYTVGSRDWLTRNPNEVTKISLTLSLDTYFTLLPYVGKDRFLCQKNFLVKILTEIYRDDVYVTHESNGNKKMYFGGKQQDDIVRKSLKRYVVLVDIWNAFTYGLGVGTS